MHVVHLPPIPKAMFPLGQVVITGTAAGILDSSAVSEGLNRHAAGDRGDTCPRTPARTKSP